MDVPLVQTAMEVMSRATTTSEVLSLNLTSLLILAVLKVAVVAFGMSNSAFLTARSSTSETVGVSATDMTGGLCFLLYTSGQEDKLPCMQRAACESPTSATELLQAAKLWSRMHALIQAVPFTDKYQGIVEAVYSAVRVGEEEESCSQFPW